MITDSEYVPSTQQIDALLEFLPVFERPDFFPSTIECSPGVFPYHVFDEELSRFQVAVYENGFVFSFDWSEWQCEAQRYFEDPELLRTADLQVLRKLITLHVRKQRFCDGHLSEMVTCGHIAALLRRLQELKPVGNSP